VTVLNATLFTVSFFTLVLWTVLAVTVLIVFFGFGSAILTKNRPPLGVEVNFWTALIVLAGLGLIVSLSLGLFAPVFVGDPGSYGLLLQLDSLPLWNTVVFLIALVILVAEGIYFFRWCAGLAREREHTIEELRAKHKETLCDLSRYIADALALHLLKRAELTDGMGGYGQYYQRMEQFSNRLDVVLE